MKKFLIISVSLVSLSGCASRLGDLTMVSTRNIDSKSDYVELKRYAKGKGKNLEDAIEKAVKEVPGGEFMKNVTVYQSGKIKVQGDVWGVSGVLSEKDQKTESVKSQFNIGDKVMFKKPYSVTSEMLKGVIEGKGDSKAVVKIDGTGEVVQINYNKLTKSE